MGYKGVHGAQYIVHSFQCLAVLSGGMETSDGQTSDVRPRLAFLSGRIETSDNQKSDIRCLLGFLRQARDSRWLGARSREQKAVSPLGDDFYKNCAKRFRFRLTSDRLMSDVSVPPGIKSQARHPVHCILCTVHYFLFPNQKRQTEVCPFDCRFRHRRNIWEAKPAPSPKRFGRLGICDDYLAVWDTLPDISNLERICSICCCIL